MKSLAVATAVAAVFAAGSAHAGFLYSDTSAPTATTVAVPANNDFRTQLAGVGVTTETFSASLATNAVGSVTIDYFAKEAMYTNSFWWNGAQVGTTPSSPLVDPFAPRFIGTFNDVPSGVLNFSFCTSGGAGMGTPGVVGAGCVTNAQNDALAPGALRGITMFISQDGNTAWLMWDDGGGGPDDNHDDMIVRLTHRVPEPATIGLLGFGLLGAGVAARRRKRG